MKLPGWKELVNLGPILPASTSKEYKTGDWRTFKPEIDYNKCTTCLFCWLFCPDSAVKFDGQKVYIDYDYCKGCGVCAAECPVKAITMKEEEK